MHLINSNERNAVAIDLKGSDVVGFVGNGHVNAVDEDAESNASESVVNDENADVLSSKETASSSDEASLSPWISFTVKVKDVRADGSGSIVLDERKSGSRSKATDERKCGSHSSSSQEKKGGYNSIATNKRKGVSSSTAAKRKKGGSRSTAFGKREYVPNASGGRKHGSKSNLSGRRKCALNASRSRSSAIGKRNGGSRSHASGNKVNLMFLQKVMNNSVQNPKLMLLLMFMLCLMS